ncbi:hypothetical protein TNCV_2098161 [Trichonephila clavipes]|nr:hypothetical protein TNCV_2098161 [Trichonephila clavipes]
MVNEVLESDDIREMNWSSYIPNPSRAGGEYCVELDRPVDHQDILGDSLKILAVISYIRKIPDWLTVRRLSLLLIITTKLNIDN